MPPSSSKSAAHSLDRLLDRSLARLLYSPSCTKLRAKPRAKFSSNTPQHHRRHASTLTSSTAINGTKPIPHRYRALHAALLDVQKTASAHINLSRLQLALQGLESESPPTRVAVLGHDVPKAARQVVRLLLADALEPEGVWEKELWEGKEDYANGILIRYGHPPNSSLPQPRTSIPIIYIPSSVLQRDNVEILIASINGQYGDLDEIPDGPPPTPDAYLSPIVGTPTSASGREVLIRQPVHQTLFIVSGLDGLTSITRLLTATKFTSSLDKSMISVAVNLPNVGSKWAADRTTIIDIAGAEEGLNAIRKSPALASTYEHKWNTSGLPGLSTWLIQACASSVKLTLIASLLNSTSANLNTQKSISATKSSSQSLSLATKATLHNAITTFSLAAHTELQSGLAAAWSSRNWRKLAWWKLFWRVDDVGLIVSDLVSNAWLPNTEKAVYELSGRLRQVGIEPVEEIASETTVEGDTYAENAAATSSTAKWQTGGTTIPPEIPYPSERQVHPQYTTASTTALLNTIPMTSASPARAYSSDARPVLTSPDGQHVELRMQSPPQPVPLSALISRVRAQTMVAYIADLTVTAQQLVFRTLSISGMSAGLSGLLYVSFDGGWYEAGTVFALGTAYALRRMQGDWMAECAGLEDGLLQEGKQVVRRVEGEFRRCVEEGARRGGDEVEEGMRRRAEGSVERAWGELEGVGWEGRGRGG
jgi:hypothetical protein